MPKKESKDKIVEKIATFFDKFPNLLVCEIKDLPANSVHRIRKDLRDIKSEVLCGKTVIIYLLNSIYLIVCHYQRNSTVSRKS